MATVQLSTCLPYDYMGNWKREKDGTRGEEYLQLKEAVANKLIASVEKIIPGLANHIVVKDVATPLTFERYTLNSCGASMGWFPAPGGRMRSQKTPIKNLYQAGAWSFPGASIYAVVPSGRNAAQLVLKEAR
jgi:phytoene dehydrogenase-like protein